MMNRSVRRLIGSAQVLRQLPLQRRLAALSPDAYAEEANRRLHDAIGFAADRVPYYRKLFPEHGIDPAAIRTSVDLERLPIQEKSAVRTAPLEFRSDGTAGRQAIPITTSGSTGEPLVVYHDPRSLVANFAYCEPEKQVVREILGPRRNVRQLSIAHSGSTLHKIWKAYGNWSFLPVPSDASLLSVETPLDEVIDTINAVRPTVLSGYGSYLEMLFRHAHNNRIEIHRPRLVSYAADAMTEDGQQLIRHRFGVPVLSRYSAVESFRIGFSCNANAGFHIRTDLCALRIVDDSGRDVEPGKSGDIVISNLVNRGSVLLNYRLGDTGAWAERPCSCGRPMPLLERLDGRSEDVLELSNGERVHPRAIWSVIGAHERITRYQLVQREVDRFELRLMTTKPSDFEAIGASVVKSLRPRLANSRIDCTYCDTLSASAGGKFRPVVSLHSLDSVP